jgi:hypothetical protein
MPDCIFCVEISLVRLQIDSDRVGVFVFIVM